MTADTFFLTVVAGADVGRVFRDLRPPVLIGRAGEALREGVCVALSDPKVSGRHAEVRRSDHGLELIDLDSTNGLYVNRERVRSHQLRNGDCFVVGSSVLEFGVSPLSTADLIPLIGTSQERVALGRFVAGQSLVTECERLREVLADNHVIWENAEESGLIHYVRRADGHPRAILGRDFHRFVLIDVNAGQPTMAGFDPVCFLTAARSAVAAAFGLDLPDRAFHAEDVFQLLKDEPQSLFCIAPLDRIPVELLHLIRGFTQGEHRVLMLCAGVRAVAQEEWEQQDQAESGSVVSDAAVQPAKPKTRQNTAWSLDPIWFTDTDVPPLPVHLAPPQAAQLAAILAYLHQRLSLVGATVVIAPNEDAVRIPFGGWQELLRVQAVIACYCYRIADPESELG